MLQRVPVRCVKPIIICLAFPNGMGGKDFLMCLDLLNFTVKAGNYSNFIRLNTE